MGTCVLRSFELILSHSSSHPRLNTTAIFFSSASIMCQVTSFFCGCADLRKGALIIGIIKLVMSLISAASALLFTFVFAGAAALWLLVLDQSRTMAVAMAVALTLAMAVLSSILNRVTLTLEHLLRLLLLEWQ